MKRCMSCQVYLGDEHEDEGGVHCPSCGDEISSADLRANGYAFSGDQWARYSNHEGHAVRERRGVWYCYDCEMGGDKDKAYQSGGEEEREDV